MPHISNIIGYLKYVSASSQEGPCKVVKDWHVMHMRKEYEMHNSGGEHRVGRPVCMNTGAFSLLPASVVEVIESFCLCVCMCVCVCEHSHIQIVIGEKVYCVCVHQSIVAKGLSSKRTVHEGNTGGT